LPDKAAPSDDFQAAKKRVTDRLMTRDFVSGVGAPGTGFTVYLTRRLSPEEQKEVEAEVSAAAPGKPVEYVVTGAFKAR
jgi:hypothetical protein